MSKQEWRKRAKAEQKVYFEFLIDSMGTGLLDGLRSSSSYGVMSPKNAKRFARLLDKIKAEEREARHGD